MAPQPTSANGWLCGSWIAREPAAVIETVALTLRFTAHITSSLRAGEWSFGGDGAAALHHCYGELSC